MKSAIWAALAAASLLSLAGCKTSGMDLGGIIGAGQSLATAATLSDEDVRILGDRTSEHEDKQHHVAPPASKHGKRLAALSADWKSVDGVNLDYKVYIKPEINAFAVPNGAIRIYSGLMDSFTDDELRYVIAHEIAHVALGHSKKAFQVAYASSAARQAAASSGNAAVSAISSSELGALGEALLKAQFSQKQENEADDFAVDFLRKKGLSATGSVTALRKLEKLNGNKRSAFSSHPAPGERAKRMEQRVAAK